MMAWPYLLEGSDAQLGAASVRPLAVDLALLVGVMNGRMDRDNCLAATIAATVPLLRTAHYVVVQAPTIGAPTSFSVERGVVPLDNSLVGPDLSVSIATDDGAIVVRSSATVLLTSTGLDTVVVGFGLMVDGEVVAHSGFTLALVDTSDAHLPFALKAAVPVDARTHVVTPFLEFAYHTSTVSAAIYKGSTWAREVAR